MKRRTWSTTEISAYLDGNLARQDQVAIEAQIEQDPALQQRVEEMRSVVAMVRSVPLRQPPRNYLLTPSMVEERKPAPRRRGVPMMMMRLATSLVALAFAVTFGLNVLQRGVTPSMVAKRSGSAQDVATIQREAVPQPQVAARATDTDTTEEPPMALEAPAPAASPEALPTPAPMGTQAAPEESEMAPASTQADTSTTDGTAEDSGNNGPGLAAGMGGGGEVGGAIQAQQLPPGTLEVPNDTQEPVAGIPEPTGEAPRAFSAATIEKSEPATNTNTLQIPEDEGATGATAPTTASTTMPAPTAPEETVALSSRPTTLPWVTFGLGIATVVLAVVTIWLSRRHVG